MIYLLDTNICIYYLKGRDSTLRDRLDSVSVKTIKLPSMVVAELFLGAEKSTMTSEKRALFKVYTEIYEIVPFDEKAAVIYAGIRADLEKRNKVIGGNDMIIAATAMAQNGTLITHNLKEFTRIPGLSVEDWCGN